MQRVAPVGHDLTETRGDGFDAIQAGGELADFIEAVVVRGGLFGSGGSQADDGDLGVGDGAAGRIGDDAGDFARYVLGKSRERKQENGADSERKTSHMNS